MLIKLLAEAYSNKRYSDSFSKKALEFSDSADYGLSGWDGVLKYIKDYSTLATLGKTGNLAVTFLGSYKLKWSVTSVDERNRSASVAFHVENSSTAQSAFRPPVIGYTDWWKGNIGSWLNTFFSSGPMSAKSQNFNWSETLKF